MCLIFDALTPIRPETKIQFTNGIDNLTGIGLMDWVICR